MATVKLSGVTYTYSVTFPTGISFSSSKLNSAYQTDSAVTATISKKPSSSITRYFHVYLNASNYGACVGIYKAVFKTTSTTGTVTKVGTIGRNVGSYGDIIFDFYDESSYVYASSKRSISLQIKASTSIASYDYFDTSSNVSATATYTGFEPSLTNASLTYSKTSSVTSEWYDVFGNVIDRCVASDTFYSQSRWTYTKGLELDLSNGVIDIPTTLAITVDGSTVSSTKQSFGQITKYWSKTVSALHTLVAKATNILSEKSLSYTFSAQNYQIPELTSFNVTRNNSDNTKADISVTYSLDSLNKDSAVSSAITLGDVYIHYQFYNASGSTVGSEGVISIVADGSQLLSLTGTKNGSTSTNFLSATESYTCQLWIEDRISESTVKTVSIPTEFRTLDFKAGGKGASFGQVAENDAVVFGTTMPPKCELDVQNIQTSDPYHAQSGDDADLYNGITDLGWNADVLKINSTQLIVKKLFSKIVNSIYPTVVSISLFDYSHVSLTTSSIAANASGEVTSSTIRKENYYPIAIASVSIATGNAALRRFYFDSRTAGSCVIKIGVQNEASSARTISVNADILWVKIAV